MMRTNIFAVGIAILLNH